MENRRGQASLETLVVAAALLAFLAVFLPFVAQTRSITRYGESAVEEKLFLATLAEDARQARLLGEGNAFARDFFLPANRTILSFDETAQSLELVFEESGKTASFSEPVGFRVALGKQVFERQKVFYSLKNEGGAIVVYFR